MFFYEKQTLYLTGCNINELWKKRGYLAVYIKFLCCVLMGIFLHVPNLKSGFYLLCMPF